MYYTKDEIKDLVITAVNKILESADEDNDLDALARIQGVMALADTILAWERD